MTPEQKKTLKWFKNDKVDIYGKPINWLDVDYVTMTYVNLLRERVGFPCVLIRGSHGEGKETAVDCIFPDAPYGLVMMEVLRLQSVSFGFYSSKTLHLDTRFFPYVPARWLAIKPEEEALLILEGLSSLVTHKKDGWVYLKWSDDLGPRALQFIAWLANQKEAT